MANYEETFSGKLDWALAFQRTGAFPLDRTDLFSSYDDAVKYAKGDVSDPDSRELCGTSYVGQHITVFENDTVTAYYIKADRTLQALATTSATGDVAADIAALGERVTALETTVNAETTGLKDRVTAAETAIDTLTGTAETDGSVAKAKADAEAYADGLNTTMDTRVDAIETYLGNDVAGAKKDLADAKAAIETLNADNTTAGSVAKTVKDAVDAAQTTLQGNIDSVSGAVDTLNGDSNTEGSVDKKIADKLGIMHVNVNGTDKTYTTVSEYVQGAITDLVGGADDAYDTLKELQTALKNNDDAATAITNTLATKADKSQLGELGTHTEEGDDEPVANTVKYYVDQQIAAANGTATEIGDRVTALENTINTETTGLSDRMDDAEDAIDAINDESTGILKTAKDYADGLASNYDAAGAADDVAAKIGDLGESATVVEYVTGQVTTIGNTIDNLENRIVANENAIATLNGTAETEGSVAKAKADAEAYADGLASNYDAAGTAETKVNALATGAVATNTSDISSIKDRLDTLEADTYVAIANDEIDALFA